MKHFVLSLLSVFTLVCALSAAPIHSDGPNPWPGGPIQNLK